MNEIEEIERRKAQLEAQKLALTADLPHLYGWPWYPWAKDFFDATEKTILLCAANQISKSSTQIRKCIDWATSRAKWKKLWPREPNQFWYLYPSKDVATIEFEKKWIPEFMPKGKMKDSPIYGWRAEYEKKHIKAVHFNNGLTVYFKTYAQDAKTLQSGSVYAIFCDEELPVNLYDELNIRLAGTQGYFHMVFTATLNQEFWWRAMEAQGTDQETLKDAWKRQISMYDCLEYLDGTKTPWSVERIKEVEGKCKSNAEILRRVYGRFIKEEGRTFHAFDPTKHFIKPVDIPSNWSKYVGVDIGSGGDNGHPSAIVFIAVRPDHSLGYVYKGWRGDNVHTTSGDVYEKYKQLLDQNEFPTRKFYDFAAVDFGTITTRLGDPFEKANKSKDLGEGILNTLLANNMLFIFDTDELRPLGVEMLNLQKSTPKTKAKDDYCDATRYPVIEIPWDFTKIKGYTEPEVKKGPSLPKTPAEYIQYEIEQRRAKFVDERSLKSGDWNEDVLGEIDYWNEMNGS